MNEDQRYQIKETEVIEIEDEPPVETVIEKPKALQLVSEKRRLSEETIYTYNDKGLVSSIKKYEYDHDLVNCKSPASQ